MDATPAPVAYPLNHPTRLRTAFAYHGGVDVFDVIAVCVDDDLVQGALDPGPGVAPALVDDHLQQGARLAALERADEASTRFIGSGRGAAGSAA
jgi:hypothetical protein